MPFIRKWGVPLFLLMLLPVYVIGAVQVLGSDSPMFLQPFFLGALSLLLCLYCSLRGAPDTVLHPLARRFSEQFIFIVLIIVGLWLRVWYCLETPGAEYDLACFVGWSQAVSETGFSGLYSLDMFIDYPPGYMYVLALVGNLVNALKIEPFSEIGVLILSLPVIISDMLLCALAFLVAKRGVGGKKGGARGVFSPTVAAMVFALSPLLIYNTAVWKQVDSFIVIALVLVFLLLEDRRYLLSAIVYGVAVVIKPQAFLFGPVFALGYFTAVVGGGEKLLNALKRVALCALVSFATIFILVLPFWGAQEPFWLFKLYFGTVSYYNYGSVNAPNLFGLLGQNFISANEGFIIPMSAWGFVFLAVLTAGLIYIWLYSAKRGKNPLLLLAALYGFGIYSFMHGMHERYILPSIVLLFFAIFKYGYRRLMPVALAASGTALLSEVVSLIWLKDDTAYQPLIWGDSFRILSACQLTVFIWLLVIAVPILLHPENGEAEYSLLKRQKLAAPTGARPAPFFMGDTLLLAGKTPLPKMSLRDILYIAVPTLLCAVVSFYALGSREVPGSGATLPPDSMPVPVSLSGEAAELWLYLDVGETEVSVTPPEGGAIELIKEGYTDLYIWKTFTIPPAEQYFLTIKNGRVLEAVFVNSGGETVPVLSCPEWAGALFDEQNTRPQRPSYMTGMYFDEVYHARTAYEYLHGLPIFETTHPPLGKEIIMLGVMLFGMNPFGWRFFGVLAGIAMLPIIYLLARRLTRQRELALLAEGLLALDFMRLTQSRIATLDVFSVMLILLSYLLMLRFTEYCPYRTPLRHLLPPLALAGVTFGVSCAVKWTGIYSGAGLCVLFFTPVVLGAMDEYRSFKKLPTGRIASLLISGGALFVLLPATIYALSYLPIALLAGEKFTLGAVIRQQGFMFNYHSDLVSEHPFASSWWEWPNVVRPVWYYMGERLPEGISESIALLGNPFIWIPALMALTLVTATLFTRYRSRAGWFVAVGFLSQYLPWILVPRETFLYHYFPALPFTLLALVMVVGALPKRFKLLSSALVLAVAAAGFIFFFPVLTGLPVKTEVLTALQLFPRWYFGG